MSIRCLNILKTSNLLVKIKRFHPNPSTLFNIKGQTSRGQTQPGFRCITTSKVNREIFNVQDVDDFKSKVLESKDPVLVDFHASWCGPCKILAPRLETIIQSKKDKVHLAKVDIDEHSELAMEYDVTAVPSVLAMKDGKVVDRFIGVIDDDKINGFVDKLIGS